VHGPRSCCLIDLYQWPSPNPSSTPPLLFPVIRIHHSACLLLIPKGTFCGVAVLAIVMHAWSSSHFINRLGMNPPASAYWVDAVLAGQRTGYL